jgi:hypothetical protein
MFAERGIAWQSCVAALVVPAGVTSAVGSGAAFDQQGADGGLGWPWVVGGLVVLGLLAAGLLAALRRRRPDDGPEESTPDPGEVDAGPGT